MIQRLALVLALSLLACAPPPPVTQNPCNPSTCTGCCANGSCFGGATANACGSAGAVCAVCGQGQVCAAGACVTPSTGGDAGQDSGTQPGTDGGNPVDSGTGTDAGSPPDSGSGMDAGGPADSGSGGFDPNWYTKPNFRKLPQEPDSDLYTHVTGRAVKGTYVDPSAQDLAAMDTLLQSLFTALDATLTVGQDGDWCGVTANAAAAGYTVKRLFDTTSQRTFLFLDNVKSCNGVAGDCGWAYLYLNPEPGRDLVIEAPHAGYDTGTFEEVAHESSTLSIRALIMNRGDRCASTTPSACTGGSTATCGGSFHTSDMAHEVSTQFFRMHVAFDGRYGSSFYQCHSNVSSPDDLDASDGSTSSTPTGKISTAFYNALVAGGVGTSVVADCQQGNGSLCGTYSVEGRYTNGAANACTGSTSSTATGRFLHVEKHSVFTGTSCAAGACWMKVRDALGNTFTSCIHNNCQFGPAQSSQPALTCP